MENSEENRELIPEFFFNYEAFLNLNHLNLGHISDENIQINDLDTGEKNGIIEFIINMRQQLEKVNIIPWVDNIFGYKQVIENEKSFGVYIIYPLSSYEKNNQYNLIMSELKKEGKSQSEILNRIKLDLNFLKIGICPVQLLKTPLNEKNMGKYNSFKKIIKEHKDLKDFVYNPLDGEYIVNANNTVIELILKTKNIG